MVTAGNCSWWEITSGAVVYLNCAMVLSGTCVAPSVVSSWVGSRRAVNEVWAAAAWVPEAGT